ncbi:MAG: alpha-xylosidase [Bacteroidales bacterium]|nr:alpha-xylosidase [Bacteroidales bacterium]
MKQTNHPLFDFLDSSSELTGEERLWKACKPTSIKEEQGDILVTLPFQKLQCSNDITPDLKAERKEYGLRIRAYGKKIIRVSIGFGLPDIPDSPMLNLHPDLKQTALKAERSSTEWIIRDKPGQLKAKFDLREPVVDHWSDLLPEPQETIVASFFPDGMKEIKISAYDQFFPSRQNAFALACIERKEQNHRATISFSAEHDEAFAGTGERFTKMDLAGHTFQLENQDGQGVNNRRTYKNIPFYISSRMYGLFMHTSAHTKFSLADHSTRSVQLMTEQPRIDLFLFSGDSIEEILYQYRQVTGFPSVPPTWSYGTWMSRMSYFSAEEVNTICARLRKEDFPCDVIHLDTGWFRTDWLCEWKFNPRRFPDPKKFISDLKKDGFKVSLWQMPYIAEKAEQHDEAKANKYIAPLKKNKEQGGSNFSSLGYAGTIDFTYPKAVEWYKNLLKELLKMGVTCIKTDFGEDIHMDADYHGMDADLLHNIYALLYQKAAFEITKEITGEGIIWARAGWAGCQRYPLHWGGDAACTWDGMAGSLKGGLHLGLSGFGFWSHDVPGFHGVPDFMNSVIPDDLYIRWTQFGVFTSHMRYHGTSKREPYEYPSISAIVRKWLKLRYALIPYLVEQGRKVSESGFPVLRALIFHHPDDRICWHIHDQYYFGDDFLVAPVMNSDSKRDVYLPEGKWINFFSGQITDGEKWLKNLKVPLDKMPVWVRYGANIPFYPLPVKSTDDMDLGKVVKIKFDKGFKGIGKTLVGEVTGLGR